MESIRTVDEYGNIRYVNEKGELHREDGPSFVFSDGTEWYYLNGLYYDSKEEWEHELLSRRLKRIKDL